MKTSASSDRPGHPKITPSSANKVSACDSDVDKSIGFDSACSSDVIKSVGFATLISCIDPDGVCSSIADVSVVNASVSKSAIDTDSRTFGDEPHITDVHKKRLSIASRTAAKSKRVDVKESKLDQADAIRGYEAFYKLSPNSATLTQVVKSSAGVSGWSQFFRVMTVVAADSESDRRLLDRQLKQQRLLSDMGVIGEVLQHEKVKRLKMHDGPTYVGGVLQPRPHCSSAINIFEVSEPIVDQSILANEAEWQDVEFEVALDSGS